MSLRLHSAVLCGRERKRWGGAGEEIERQGGKKGGGEGGGREENRKERGSVLQMVSNTKENRGIKGDWTLWVRSWICFVIVICFCLGTGFQATHTDLQFIK